MAAHASFSPKDYASNNAISTTYKDMPDAQPKVLQPHTSNRMDERSTNVLLIDFCSLYNKMPARKG